MLIKYVYVVFVGILLAAFVGVGIAAFYKGPTYPKFPNELQYAEVVRPGVEPGATQSASTSAEKIRLQEEWDRKNEAYQQENGIYQRNVSIIALIAAIVMLVVSLTLVKQIQVIADGLLLGGVLTLGYSVIRGFGSNDDMVRFLVVTASLFIALILGYIKFVRPATK